VTTASGLVAVVIRTPSGASVVGYPPPRVAIMVSRYAGRVFRGGGTHQTPAQ
jgi:hypothetical protein